MFYRFWMIDRHKTFENSWAEIKLAFESKTFCYLVNSNYYSVLSKRMTTNSNSFHYKNVLFINWVQEWIIIRWRRINQEKNDIFAFHVVILNVLNGVIKEFHSLVLSNVRWCFWLCSFKWNSKLRILIYWPWMWCLDKKKKKQLLNGVAITMETHNISLFIHCLHSCQNA